MTMSFLCLTLAANMAHAVPVQGIFVDDPRCDFHPQTTLSHELGNVLSGFPIDEGLDVRIDPGKVVCVGDDGIANDFAVTITNVSPNSWVDLFFVADEGTLIGNADGSVSDLTAPGFTDAFKIDNLGSNANLVAGDNGNLIFEPGEAWTFMVANFIAPASTPPFPVLGSVGAFSVSSSGDPLSNASILANPVAVPEPSTTVMTILGLLGLPLLTRRRLRTAHAKTSHSGVARRRLKSISLMVVAALFSLVVGRSAMAELGGFETANGYAGPFPQDVWSYDAGQTGASFIPSQYNTGRWVELTGSSNAGADAQYISQHGYGSGGANVAPFALAVRAIAPSTDGSFDMTVRYGVGVDDLGISPSTPLQSATIGFDICPGGTVIPGSGFDTVFNDVPAFSLSFGGTDAAPGATIGFSDHDPGNANRARLTYIDGSTYNSQAVNWTSGRFDHLEIALDMINQTYDLTWTKDANLATKEFDAGNTPTVIASGASFTNGFSMLDFLYFRTHTDPSNGQVQAGLEKSFLDNFEFSVRAETVPEPSSLLLSAMAFCGGGMLVRRRRAAKKRSAIADNVA